MSTNAKLAALLSDSTFRANLKMLLEVTDGEEEPATVKTPSKPLSKTLKIDWFDKSLTDAEFRAKFETRANEAMTSQTVPVVEAPKAKGYPKTHGLTTVEAAEQAAEKVLTFLAANRYSNKDAILKSTGINAETYKVAMGLLRKKNYAKCAGKTVAGVWYLTPAGVKRCSKAA